MGFFEVIKNIYLFIEHILLDYALLYALLFGGLFLTIRLGFPQIRQFKRIINGLFGKRNYEVADKGVEKGKKSVSSFQALSTAIAAQVGTGNVAGVATAITAGGPGAIFWMWVSALFGMGSIFTETILGQVYKTKRNGETVSGPAYYIKEGLNKKVFASIFAGIMVIAGGITCNMVQVNAIAEATRGAFNIPNYITGIFVAFVVGLVIIGGVNRIAKFASIVVPFMSIVYIICGVSICVMYRENLGAAFSMIFKGAFTPAAAGGGFAGITVKEAMRFGVARGLYSNEAGIGTTPHVHGIADVAHPVQQALVAMVGVFIDTMVVCSMTALVILTTGVYKVKGLEAALITQEAFSMGFGSLGKGLLAICLIFFAFTTILGWSYFGETNVKFLFNDKAINIYRVVVVCFLVVGSLAQVPLVWRIQDLLNGFMAVPNIIVLILLSGKAKEVLEDYNKCMKNGVLEYHFEYNK